MFKKYTTGKLHTLKLDNLIDEWNNNEFVANSKYTHFPLDKKGIEQALEAAESMVKKEKWDTPSGGPAKDNLVIWTSPLMRTLQTAKVIKFYLEVTLGTAIEIKACPDILEAITNVEGLGFGDVFFNPTIEEAAGLVKNDAWSNPENKYQNFLKRAYKSSQREDLSDVHFEAMNASENVDKKAKAPERDFDFQPQLNTEQEITTDYLTTEFRTTARLGTFWKMQDPEFVPKKLEGTSKRLYATPEGMNVTVPKAFSEDYPNYSKTNQYRVPGEQQCAERFNEIAHRALRIIAHASRQEKEVIMVTHGDVCSVAHMYNRLLRVFPNKSEFIYDPRCPHPTQNTFPWFDRTHGKKFIGMYPGKASCTTLTFEDATDDNEDAKSYRPAKSVTSVQPGQVADWTGESR